MAGNVFENLTSILDVPYFGTRQGRVYPILTLQFQRPTVERDEMGNFVLLIFTYLTRCAFCDMTLTAISARFHEYKIDFCSPRKALARRF